MRTTLLTLILAGVASAADTPTVPEDVRDKAVAAWRQAHDERVKRLKEVVAGPVTTPEGRQKKTAAEAELKRLEKEPLCVPPTSGPFFFGVTSSPPAAALPGLSGRVTKAGPFGNLIDPAVRVVIVPKGDRPALVRMERETIGPDARRVFVHDKALAKSAAGQSVRLTGIYYVAGHEKADGKDVPILVRIEVKPDELPPDPADKK